MPLEFKRVEHHSNRARKNTTCIFATHKEITMKWKQCKILLLLFFCSSSSYFQKWKCRRENNIRMKMVILLCYIFMTYVHILCRWLFRRINPVHSFILFANYMLCNPQKKKRNKTKPKNNAWQKNEWEGGNFSTIEFHIKNKNRPLFFPSNRLFILDCCRFWSQHLFSLPLLIVCSSLR